MSQSACGDPIRHDDVEIVDCDTIEARGHRWRLVGFDTPEFSSRFRSVSLREKRLAVRAADRLEYHIKSGVLDLREVRCACPETKRLSGECNYGRRCGVLTVNGEDVADLMIADGVARSYHRSATKCPRQLPW